MANKSINPEKLNINFNFFVDKVIRNKYSMVNTIIVTSSIWFRIFNENGDRSGSVSIEKEMSEITIKA